jgi:hypothetical protein
MSTPPAKKREPFHTMTCGDSKDVLDAESGRDVNGFAFTYARVQDHQDASGC